MSNILSSAYFLLNHPCMRHPGRSYSTSYGNLQEPNACTVHCTITNFFWTRMSRVDGQQRDAAGFNLCTAMLNSFATDGTPYLCKHALVVIACVRPNLASRCLCRAVLMNYLILYTAHYRAYTCEGGFLWPGQHLCHKEAGRTPAPTAPRPPALNVLLTLNGACKNTLI